MKLLITYQLPKAGLKEIFEKFDVIYPENKQAFSEEEMTRLAKDADAVISVFLQKFDNNRSPDNYYNRSGRNDEF